MKILVLPGMGDIHWVMLKMESFIEQHCSGERPLIYIWDFDGRRRSEDFVRRIPFVEFASYWEHPIDRTFTNAYMKHKDQLVANYKEFDYFFCVNGGLRVGDNFESQILPGYKVNWDYEINLSDIEPRQNDMMFYFSNHGMFTNWLKYLPAVQLRHILREVVQMGYKPVLTGSAWDKELNDELMVDGVENLCGQTTLKDLFALMKGTKMFVGWCGGNTMVAPHIGTKTLMLWSNYFGQGFRTNWIKPEKIGTLYHHMDVAEGSQEIIKKIRQVCGK